MTFTIPTSLGTVRIELKGDTIIRILLAGSADGGYQTEEKASLLQKKLITDFARYFAGEQVPFLDYKVELSTRPAFTRQVLETTRRIPYGERRTYGEIARMIGRHKAARAVGQALSHNPVPIIIPCHRVIGAGGDLTGFTGGIEWKRYLLALEARNKFGAIQ